MNEIDRLKRDWDELAEIDSMWAICSDPSKAGGKWSSEEFFASGEAHVGELLTRIQVLVPGLHMGSAMDFGCGIGRLTQALARRFDQVVGVDIAPGMIERARQLNPLGDRCTYVLNERGELADFTDESFDFIYTYIVLQHMPPELMLGYLDEFVRLLRPGGILAFHAPVERLERDAITAQLRRLPRLHPRRLQNKLRGLLLGHDTAQRYERLRRLGLPGTWLYSRFGYRPRIQMHVLPERKAQALLTHRRIEVLGVEESTDLQSRLRWAEYVVRKPNEAGT